MSSLYMVATPIGNLRDITLRALDVLREADIIVCEDTRHSLKLLSAYEIRKPLVSCHGHNEAQVAERVVARIKAGETAAYISDAGTPGISDPGTVLVRHAREAGVPVVPIPGASAFTSLLCINHFPGKTVVFEGFLSPKAGRRRTRLQQLLAGGASFVLYESPYRTVKLLGDLAELAPERNVLVGREMTKMHEEYLTGTAEEIFEELSRRNAIKGEVSVLVAGDKKS